MDQDKINQIRSSKYEQQLQELCEWERSYLEKERYISRTFLNYKVVYTTFWDIKDYLKNLSSKKVVLYNCQYLNEY